MRDTRQEDKLKAIEDVISDALGEFSLKGNVSIRPYAERIIRAIEDIDTDYHNKWEEMKCEEQYQEKPEC